jgi:hypothetical protein
MASLIDVMNPVIEALEGAEIRVTVSMRDIDPPCVFLPVPALAYRFKDGGLDADLRPVCISPNTDRATAIGVLSDLLEATQAALNRRSTSGRPVEVLLADNSAALLAYELSFQLTVRNC